MFFSPVFLFFASFFFLVAAQTTTFTDASGNTLVGVVTVDAQGDPTTDVLQTLTSTSTPTSTPTTDGGVGAGPVGAPAATTASAGAPTPYTYTTVINGVTSVIADIFTPTSPSTVTKSIPATGTILDFGTWKSIYGPPPGSDGQSISISFFLLCFTTIMTVVLL
ncbi:hypothetical protein D9613_007668 [Agrocybe pediades]|uniref:Uncharacterized protein n=1 Tax=Agrocybe pediades TaxID=84607 RepID=A0A8H4VKV9_9AGAR|nr:hypothetical protein D9613_007668 [Agrocybe pediades]KAF9565424.1 hypothetical protein CPC08DRAFT_759609 [Agrocybe pediades]